MYKYLRSPRLWRWITGVPAPPWISESPGGGKLWIPWNLYLVALPSLVHCPTMRLVPRDRFPNEWLGLKSFLSQNLLLGQLKLRQGRNWEMSSSSLIQSFHLSPSHLGILSWICGVHGTWKGSKCTSQSGDAVFMPVTPVVQASDHPSQVMLPLLQSQGSHSQSRSLFLTLPSFLHLGGALCPVIPSLMWAEGMCLDQDNSEAEVHSSPSLSLLSRSENFKAQELTES